MRVHPISPWVSTRCSPPFAPPQETTSYPELSRAPGTISWPGTRSAWDYLVRLGLGPPVTISCAWDQVRLELGRAPGTRSAWNYLVRLGLSRDLGLGPPGTISCAWNYFVAWN